MKTENLVTWRLPNHIYYQLLVRKQGETEWTPIATLKVTSDDFWKQLGYGLGIVFKEMESTPNLSPDALDAKSRWLKAKSRGNHQGGENEC